MRCTIAAVVVSFLQNLIDSVGIGWTFTFMAGLCLIATGLFAIDYSKGTSWRQGSIAHMRGREPDTEGIGHDRPMSSR